MFMQSNTSSSSGRGRIGNYVTVARQPTALQMKGELLFVPYKLITVLSCVRKMKIQIKLCGYCAGIAGMKKDHEESS